MANPEQHEVHIQTLYKRIEELDKDCVERDKNQFEATLRVHKRIDDFIGVLTQMSEINKDVQSLITHQKALDTDHKDVKNSLNNLERQMTGHASTIQAVHRIAWSVAGFVCVAVGIALFKLIGLAV